MALCPPARPSAKESRTKSPTESEQSYRMEGFTFPPYVKARPGKNEIAPPLYGIVR